jgi:signal transduction histidine kinase
MYGDGTHSFSLSLNGSSTPVLADPGRLEQVWSNLLDNAVKYSPRGGDIRVRLEATDDDGFEVSVSDSGIGMPAGAEGTIFQPFSRATNATAGQFAGMGLGLYICRKIIERHGGRMWAKSPGENHGTTVRVWLPRYTDREAEQAPASAQ